MGSAILVLSDLIEFVILFIELVALSCIFFDTFAATFATVFIGELDFAAFRRTVFAAFPEAFPRTVLRAFADADVFPITALIAFVPFVVPFPRAVLMALALDISSSTLGCA